MKKICFFIVVSLTNLLANQGFSQGKTPGQSILDDGFPLPFLEQWNTGTFETNYWLIGGENWSINWQEGQSLPSAEFTWDPILTDYQVVLESYPLLADSLTAGQIWLDFDLKLDSYQPTGAEQMLVQVWNWYSQVWTTVSTYSNIDGSFDWVSEHLDITNQAMSTVFKIRFAATGENSLNILGWFVDNIHVYRECKAPDDISVNFFFSNDYGMLVEWENPYEPVSEWIEWDDGNNSGNSIGIGDAVEFDCAARWTPVQLSEYDGAAVEQVSFFPAEAFAEYRIRVWIGAGAANMVVDQLVENPIIGQWNDIPLNSSVNIDITQELWVGYHVNAQTGYPAGVDDGPAIDGYGNMMNFGGWQTLLEINDQLDYNWNIKAFIHRTQATDTVAQYAVYRSEDGNPYFFIAYTDEEEFYDNEIICEDYPIFCYYVTAIYSSEIDWCESGPSNESCDICPIGIKEDQNSFALKIYPNPASDLLFIESSEDMESVRIFDSRGGQVVRWSGGQGEMRKQGDGETWRIPVAGLAPGLYLVRVETGKGMVNRKIIVKN